VGIDDLWKPNLLHLILLCRCCPDAREHFIRDFHFDQVLKENPEIRQQLKDEIVELLETTSGGLSADDLERALAPIKARPSVPMDEDITSLLARARESQDPSYMEAIRRLVHAVPKEATPTISEMVDTLLSTGRYEYLKDLISHLYFVEKQGGQK
jgi:hypothetical protein